MEFFTLTLITDLHVTKGCICVASAGRLTAGSNE